MKAIQSWLKAHSITSQSVAYAWVAAVMLYSNNPDFHSYIQAAYSALPKGLHSFIVGIAIPVAIFWRTTHVTTVTATVEDGSGQTAAASAVTTAPKI